MTKNLKPIPKGNKGLGNLPESVRNTMGFMKKGSKVSKAKIKPKPKAKRVVKKRKTTKRKK
tara:strand:- start:39 stop:221 length:183 start_codon:yes stop_codon:yes gene_type:complete